MRAAKAVAVRITRRSQVQVLPPLLQKKDSSFSMGLFCLYAITICLQNRFEYQIKREYREAGCYRGGSLLLIAFPFDKEGIKNFGKSNTQFQAGTCAQVICASVKLVFLNFRS